MQLGRLGVWYPVDRLSAQQLRDLVVRVERLGYDALWYPESRGYELFSVAGYMLGCSQKLKLGSSIASIYARDAFTAARGAMTLNAMYGERFVLGLGVSHAPMVEKIRGHTYQKPVPQMREYLQGVHRAADADIPLAIAALGPLMLKLAAEATHGALPYNTTPEHTRKARAILGPDKWLAVEQKVCLETNAVRARALGRKELERYLRLDNYRNNWLRIGFTEQDLAEGGSDRFIDAMVLWGDTETVQKGLRAHFDAGASHVCLQPVHEEGDVIARDRIVDALAGT